MTTLVRIRPLALTLLIAAAAPAHAEYETFADQVHPMVGLGLFGGGGTLATVTFTNGSTKKLGAGGLVDLRVGGDWRPLGKPYSAQLSIGYFVDRVFASNGSVTFQRIPIELLGYYNVVYPVRVGGGLRLTSGAKLSGSGVAATLGSTSFKTSPGLVLEAEYLFQKRFSLAGRFVAESYKAPNGATFSGNHAGLRVNAYF